MKLILENILNELGLKPQASPGEQKHNEQRTRIQAIMKGVDQGKEEVQQSQDGTMYYKGGVLHRETGPAIVPRGAEIAQLDGGVEMVKGGGGEYYLYGKRAPDFSVWYRHVLKLRAQRGNMPPDQAPESQGEKTTQLARPKRQFQQQGASGQRRGPGGQRR